MSDSKAPSDIEPKTDRPKQKVVSDWDFNRIFNIAALIFIGYLGFEIFVNFFFLFGLIWICLAVIILATSRSGQHPKTDLRLVGGGLLLTVLLMSAFLLTTDEGAVVVDESGSVSTVIPFVRSVIQPDRFYRAQLKLVEDNIKWLVNSHTPGTRQVERMNADIAKTMQALQPAIDEVKKGTNQEVMKFYSDHPESRPLVAEASAENLRERADALEKLANDKRLADLYDREFAKALESMQKTRNAIQRKLGPI